MNIYKMLMGTIFFIINILLIIEIVRFWNNKMFGLKQFVFINAGMTINMVFIFFLYILFDIESKIYFGYIYILSGVLGIYGIYVIRNILTFDAVKKIRKKEYFEVNYKFNKTSRDIHFTLFLLSIVLSIYAYI